MTHDAIIVGGGIAGLTAACFLAKAGQSVLLCEKENTFGGLINSFEIDGFVYDGGIRATEDSGVLFPMLRALGLDVEFVRNHVSLGIEDRVIRVNTEENIAEYQAMLIDLYPESKQEIEAIIVQIKKIMHYMDVQYGIDNPVFLDFKKDRNYLVKEILPWMFKYLITSPKIAALNKPVVEFLRQFTSNQCLLDIITQHFFRDTPAFFALSYLKLYVDYNYPLGGTGKLIQEMLSFYKNHQGEVSPNTEIARVDPEHKVVVDKQGKEYHYRRLIWAADLNALYRNLNSINIPDDKVKHAITARKSEIESKAGNDSVLSLFLGLNLPKEYFASIASEHFFYTPNRKGQTLAGDLPLTSDRAGIEKWLDDFFAYTTYEISIPALRDASLAPPDKTGLIISVLFDYKLTKYIENQGWYPEFKAYCEKCIINTLESSIYPGIKDGVVHQHISTPLTMEKLTGNTEGAITGWALYNNPIPAESRIPKIMQAIVTPIPGVFQAGQWTYSPSGFPISILTGKIAADRVIKELKKETESAR